MELEERIRALREQITGWEGEMVDAEEQAFGEAGSGVTLTLDFDRKGPANLTAGSKTSPRPKRSAKEKAKAAKTACSACW